MYVPAWPPLHPAKLLPGSRVADLPFPLDAEHRNYFYRARNAIFHLFRALHFQRGEIVLVPDYHSGNEVWAMRAAGATLNFYSIRRNLAPDLEELTRLFRRFHPRAILVIHYLGWPQPLREIQELCREYGTLLIEDCALALFSETRGRPLGSFGDYAVFCLYKTLPLPNGGLLVQNNHVLKDLENVSLQPCGVTSVAGRTAELLLEWIRSRADSTGRALRLLKRAVGRSLSALKVDRIPVGDIGFDPAQVHIGMSPVCEALLGRFDHRLIRQRRRENFRLLHDRLAGKVPVLPVELEEGICPLFFPVLARDKHATAMALRGRGIEAVEFWNFGDAEAGRDGRSDAEYLRSQVLELPIHQGVTTAQIEYMAQQVIDLGHRL